MSNLLVSLILLIVCISSASGLTCYYCQNCPAPFYPSGPGVITTPSVTGYCMKQSSSPYSTVPASRGAAPYGYCSRSGCSTADTSGRTVYYCCCTRDYCNTGSLTSKSTIAVLLGALALLAVN